MKTYRPDLRCKLFSHEVGTCCHRPATGVKLWTEQAPGPLNGKTLYAPRCEEHKEESHEPLDSGKATGFWQWERNTDG